MDPGEVEQTTMQDQALPIDMLFPDLEDTDEDQGTSQSQDSPIRILPPELLAEIFNHCTVHNPYFTPVLLSHVSTLWRRTTITTPRLWRNISARIPAPTHSLADKVRTWLMRSGTLPLYISLVVTEWTDEAPDFAIFIALRKHGGHWGRFSLTAASYNIARRLLVFFTSAPHHGSLSRIDINIGSLRLTDVFDEDQFEGPDGTDDARGDITIVFFAVHVLSVYAPRLTELNLASSTLPYSSWGSTSSPELPTLRTLRIFERSDRFGQIDASSILDILAKCPALEHFSFRGWYFFEPRSDPVGIVHLPRLRELHIAQTFHQRILLSSIFTPSLQVLRFSWLNRPELLPHELYEPDPPEENEDPTEYSQSPHTDVLTGVGLRSLIKRSMPPIRVLDMDFADARSPKDFVWLFAHLPTLETFRIIGSDMSDKVLYALTSPGDDGRWLCPKITSLELSRCDVITGRGLIALANGRNPPLDTEEQITDEHSRPRPARLKQFSVEACANIDCESIAVKQYILGDVDFEVEVMPSWRIFPEDGLQMPD